MTKTKLSLLAATLMASSVAFASSHREAPAISNDPQADNTDLWAWVDSSLATLHIVANYIPLEEPSGGPNFAKFSDDVLYQIHIAGNASGTTGSLADTITYNIRFTTTPQTYAPGPYLVDGGLSTVLGGQEFFAQLAGSFLQTYTVTQVVTAAGGAQTSTVLVSNAQVAPPNIGPRTDAVAYSALFAQASGGPNPADAGYTDAFAATFVTKLTAAGFTGGSAWAGPRDDGFYVDLGGVFDLANLRPRCVGTNTSLCAQDGVAGFNVHSIDLEIPVTQILGKAATAGASDAQTIGVWASASRPKVNIYRNDGTHTGVGPWVQVSREGLPLINEAVIGLQDKDKYNRTTPVTDVANFASYFLTPVIVADAVAVGIIPVAQAETVQIAHNLPTADIINVISLTNQPTTGAHHLQTNLSNVGDVLRVDLGIVSAFPCGRSFSISGTASNTEDAPVTDIELTLLIEGASALSGTLISQGAVYNDATFLTTTPWQALPWQGWSGGHGKPTP